MYHVNLRNLNFTGARGNSRLDPRMQYFNSYFRWRFNVLCFTDAAGVTIVVFGVETMGWGGRGGGLGVGNGMNAGSELDA